jgi:hypothetical protein
MTAVAVEVVAAEIFAERDPGPGGDVVGERVGGEDALLRPEDRISHQIVLDCEDFGVVADHPTVIPSAVEEHQFRRSVVFTGAEPPSRTHLLRHLVEEEPVERSLIGIDDRF